MLADGVDPDQGTLWPSDSESCFLMIRPLNLQVRAVLRSLARKPSSPYESGGFSPGTRGVLPTFDDRLARCEYE